MSQHVVYADWSRFLLRRTKLKDCKESDVAFALPTIDTYTTVVLVWRKGKESNADLVEDYLQNMTCPTAHSQTARPHEIGQTAQVSLLTGHVKEQQEQYNLWRYSWSAIEQQIWDLFSVEVNLEHKQTRPAAKLTGTRAGRASDWLKARVRQVVVQQQNFQKVKERYAQWRRCAMDALKEKTDMLGPAGSAAERQDTTGNIGYYIYADGMLKIACFREDERMCRQIYDEICSFCLDYKELEWCMPPRSTVPDDLWRKFGAERSKPDYLQILKASFKLAIVPEWHASSLRLCGRCSHVDAAFGYLDCQLGVRTDRRSLNMPHIDAPWPLTALELHNCAIGLTREKLQPLESRNQADAPNYNLSFDSFDARLQNPKPIPTDSLTCCTLRRVRRDWPYQRC